MDTIPTDLVSLINDLLSASDTILLHKKCIIPHISDMTNTIKVAKHAARTVNWRLLIEILERQGYYYFIIARCCEQYNNTDFFTLPIMKIMKLGLDLANAAFNNDISLFESIADRIKKSSCPFNEKDPIYTYSLFVALVKKSYGIVDIFFDVFPYRWNLEGILDSFDYEKDDIPFESLSYLADTMNDHNLLSHEMHKRIYS